MTAQETIKKIKAQKTTYMGVIVNEFNYAIEVRNELQKMAEAGKLSPSEYWKALNITWPEMSESEKKAENFQ